MIYLDDMYLVPADHNLYFKMEKPISTGDRLEFYGRYDGTVDGYVVANTTGVSQLRFALNEIKAENWGWPVEVGSVFVFVGDRPEPLTKVITSVCDIDVTLARRSMEFAA